MKNEILLELKRIANKIGVNLKDILFNHNPDIVLLEDENNVKKSIESKIIVKGEFKNNVRYSTIIIPDNYKSNTPLHLCFYLKRKDSKQNIKAKINIGENSEIKIFSYCFSNDSEGFHIDNKTIEIEKNSKLELYELHFTTNKSYLTTIATGNVIVKENSYFKNEFISTTGNMGNARKIIKVDIVGKNGIAELVSKMDLKSNDKYYSYNSISLSGNHSKGTIKSNTVTRQGGENIFKGIMNGIGDYSIGHIDCNEILIGKGTINSKPELYINNPTSKITHEAAIGSIEKNSIDNLRIKGLSVDQATDFIIKGILN